MGSGASKDNGGGAKQNADATPPPAKAAPAKAAPAKVKKQEAKDKKAGEEFLKLCQQIFTIADKDQNQKLSFDEFWAAFNSKTLNLNLSKVEMMDLRDLTDTDGDGEIDFEEFKDLVANLREKVKQIYQNSASDANDWCLLKDVDTGKFMYMNKRTGRTQKEKPRNFHEHRVEELKFDHITLDDGTVISVYKDAKTDQYMYMDWENGEWTPMKEEWQELIGKEQTYDPQSTEPEGNATVEDTDDRLGSFEHPTKGVFSTYLFSNERNTRLFFDDDSGTWVRMPLSWERNVDAVKAMLAEIDATLPAWKNVNEQLLVLRDCNYDVNESVSFAEINFGYSENDVSVGGSGRPSIRPKSAANKLDRTARRRSMHTSVYVENDDNAVLNIEDMSSENMSQPVAARMDELMTENARLTKELDEMKQKALPAIEEEMKDLKREKTKMDKEVTRRKSVTVNAEDRLANLSDKLKEQRDEIAELEAELVTTKSELEQAKLEKSTSDGGDKVDAAEAEAQRLKLLEANMTICELKKEADKFDGAALKHMAQEVREIRKIKDTLVESHTDFLEMEISFKGCKTLVERMSTSLGTEVVDLRQKYRAEVIKRKQLYNKIQEMRGNIRVFCRCRSDKRVKCVLQFPTKTEMLTPTLTGAEVTVDFDAAYGPDSKQAAIFADAKPVIMSVVDGYNVCIMAYGQTGSGKTYTMMGPPEDPGVNRRAIQQLLTLVEEAGDTLEVELHVAMLEVYNENVFDLLAPEGRVKRDVKSGPGGAYVHNITERPIVAQDDVERAMADGQEHRTLAATSMNSESSRSHLILQLRVDTHNKISKIRSSSKLTLVDLAGSERVAKSEVSGPQLVEAAAINKSLSALGQVFQAIAKSSPHVPYRNSKLTHVLQDSLGGDSKTCMFINIRPDEDNLSETWSTLKFGQNIRKIELGPAKKHQSKMPPPPKGKKK